MTEAELLRRQIKTKTGRNFTRFSIKNILQNPVYLIADQDAWRYFVEKQADLFSAPEEFDGVRGILAYSRTDQEKGRATVYLPTSEWIVSVGQHPGLIPANRWIQVQESLERNKSKGYHKTPQQPGTSHRGALVPLRQPDVPQALQTVHGGGQARLHLRLQDEGAQQAQPSATGATPTAICWMPPSWNRSGN